MFSENVQGVINETLQKYDVRGLVVLVAHAEQIEPDSIYLGTDVKGVPVSHNSLFPVASISKLATALTVLRLIDEGAFGLDDPLSHHVPEASAAQPDVTIRTLLCHTGGLPQDFPNEAELYAPKMNWQALANECLRVPLSHPPLTRVLYSNIGYGLLAVLVQNVTRRSFRANLQSLVLDPLGVEGYLGDQLPRSPMRIADVRSRHAGTELEPFNSLHWRAKALPWAGLITTAGGALALIRAFAGYPHDFLSETLRAEATHDQTKGLPGGYGGRFEYSVSPWGLGPDIRDNKTPHWAPAHSSHRTFGHAGASGAVVWYDPDAELAWCILGTRTADNAWLLYGSAEIGAALFQHAQAPEN